MLSIFAPVSTFADSIRAGLHSVPMNASAHPASRPAFDTLADAFVPHLAPGDPFAWPMKVRALASDSYTFWRGSKHHFYAWSRTACADWLADPSRFIITHGDPHFGNIGTYPASAGFGELSLGFVDFDEAVSLPPEMELLQGYIVFRLTAQHMKLPWTARLDHAVQTTLSEHYRASAAGDASPRQLLADLPLAVALFDDRSKSYEDMVHSMTTTGQFDRLLGKPQAPADLLRRTPELIEPVARALTRAAAEQPALGRQLRYSSAESFRHAIRDIGQRTRLKSSGSQGLKKFFVLIRSPFHAYEGDVVLYLKQEVVAPGEHQRLTPPHEAGPGARVAGAARALSPEQWYVNAHVTLNNEAYWVTLREPWGSELDLARLVDRDDLVAAVRIWATVAGCAHRAAGMDSADWLTTERVTQIATRSAQYLALHQDLFEEFRADPRVISLVGVAEASIAALSRSRSR